MASAYTNQSHLLQVADGLVAAGSACISKIGVENATNGVMYLTDALPKYKQIFGNSPHDKVAVCLHKLGHAYGQLGLPTKNRSHIEFAYKLFEASYIMYKDLKNETMAQILYSTRDRCGKSLQTM